MTCKHLALWQEQWQVREPEKLRQIACRCCHVLGGTALFLPLPHLRPPSLPKTIRSEKVNDNTRIHVPRTSRTSSDAFGSFEIIPRLAER